MSSYNRKELDGPIRGNDTPKTHVGATRMCGKCSAIKPASGRGGRVLKVFGWICAECAERIAK